MIYISLTFYSQFLLKKKGLFAKGLGARLAILRVSTLVLFKVSVVVGVELLEEVPSLPADVTTSTTLRPHYDHTTTPLRPHYDHTTTTLSSDTRSKNVTKRSPKHQNPASGPHYSQDPISFHAGHSLKMD